MSLTLLPRGTGSRRADDRIAELEARIRELETTNEKLSCDLARTIVRASQDAMWRAQADEENGRLKKRVRELGDKVIRGAAEHARLRQAVINARPRIREVPTDLVRPYSPEVVLPYVSPVPYRSTANDETQQLPILDLPSTTR